MPAPAPRRFSISDAMVLIAASAVGLIALRPFLMEFGPGNKIDALIAALRKMSRSDLIRSIPSLGLMTCPTPASLSLALLLLRLRRPRPRIGRLARQPGFAACVAALLADLASAATLIALRGTFFLDISSSDVGWGQFFACIVLGATPVASGFVALAWLGLAISRN